MAAPSLQTPPEFADAGYWYVFETLFTLDEDIGQNVRRPPEFVKTAFTATYGTVDGVEYVVMRTAKPIVGAQSSRPSQQVINAAFNAGHIPTNRKPRGRVGGR